MTDIHQRTADRADIAAAIRAEIARAGLSQRALAGQLGKSQAWVSNVKRGKLTPSADDLLAIARALNVKVATLLPEEP